MQKKDASPARQSSASGLKHPLFMYSCTADHAAVLEADLSGGMCSDNPAYAKQRCPTKRDTASGYFLRLLRGFCFVYSFQIRYRITAASARESVSPGASLPFLPFTTPYFSRADTLSLANAET